VQDVAGNFGSGDLTQVWSIDTTPTNHTPTLTIVTNRIISEGTKLVITNTASDIDLPTQQLTFALGAGAPEGAAIDAVSGIFTWRPNAVQGPLTYPISVIVSDNGQPSLSATQSFQVRVIDRLPDLTIVPGTTNIFADTSATVPVRLLSPLALTNVAFDIQASPALLTSFSAQATSADVLGLAQANIGPGQTRVTISLKSGAPSSTNRALMDFGFSGVSNNVSGIATLEVSGIQALRQDGSVVTNTASRIGRVIVIGREPVVLESSPADQAIMLFGLIGTNYVIETTPSLNLPIQWTTITNVTLSNTVQRIALPFNAPAGFYRARY
jgi:hypothetical protein